MYLRLTLMGMWVSVLMLLALPLHAGSYEAQAPQDAKTKLERIMLKQQHGLSLQKRMLEKVKTRWQSFRKKQQERPLLDRMLRWCLLCALGAIVFGALAAPLSNVSIIFNTLFSILGSAAALGALFFFLVWIVGKV
ncbi:MAG: hypothetical protein AAF927_19080 [Bacteroidota bacterium]